MIPTSTHAAATTTKSAWLDALGTCESHGRTHLKHLDSNNEYSYGFLQFQMNTWLPLGKPFGTTKENIFDITLQKNVATSLLDNGQSWRWKHCAAKVTKKLGNYQK